MKIAQRTHIFEDGFLVGQVLVTVASECVHTFHWHWSSRSCVYLPLWAQILKSHLIWIWGKHAAEFFSEKEGKEHCFYFFKSNVSVTAGNGEDSQTSIQNESSGVPNILHTLLFQHQHCYVPICHILRLALSSKANWLIHDRCQFLCCLMKKKKNQKLSTWQGWVSRKLYLAFYAYLSCTL